MMRWSRKNFSILALSVFWLITAIWGVGQVRAKQQEATTLQNTYNRAFFESMQRTKNVEVLLSKGMVSGSSQNLNALFSDLWFNANAAQSNLHQLPLSHKVVAETSKFLTQVGDYAYSLTKRENKGPLSDKDYATMQNLSKTAGSLTKEMTNVEQEAAAGRLQWSNVQGGLSDRLSSGSTTSADNTFRRVDTQLQEVPTLVYDGPFSDQVNSRQPLGLTGNNFTVDQARNIARTYVDWQGATPRQTRSLPDIRGKIPAYSFEYMMGDQPWQVITVNVSKKGGHVVYMIYPRQVAKRSLTDDQAREKARLFLTDHGFPNLVPTYSVREQNVLVLTCADRQGQVTIYPDQIKVQVALDNGQILGVEALGYLTAHHTRTLPAPKLTPAEARAKVNPRLQILSERLALIPAAGLKEILTYEFKTKLSGNTYLVYINALNGYEEQILRLLDLPNGTLSL